MAQSMKATFIEDEVFRIKGELLKRHGKLAPACAAGILNRAKKTGNTAHINLMNNVIKQMFQEIPVCRL